MAQVERTQADIDRLTVTAPIAGEILQCKVRPGEYAQSGPLPQPLILMGDTSHLNVRADVDEQDAWRVRAGAAAVASPRGQGSRRYPLRFVRFEPYVIPKKNLTNDATERTDTRVLQVIFALDRSAGEAGTADGRLCASSVKEVMPKILAFGSTAHYRIIGQGSATTRCTGHTAVPKPSMPNLRLPGTTANPAEEKWWRRFARTPSCTS